MTDRDWPQRKATRLGPWEVTVWWDSVNGSPQVVGIDVRSFHSSADGGPGAAPVRREIDLRDGTTGFVETPGEFTGLEPIDGEALAVVTKALLRDLPWESLREGTRRNLRNEALATASRDSTWAPISPEAKARARERAKALSEPLRASYSPEHWDDVAQVYNDAVARGDRHPTSAVRDQLIPPRMERDRERARTTAANWVRNARKMGLIAPLTMRRKS